MRESARTVSRILKKTTKKKEKKQTSEVQPVPMAPQQTGSETGRIVCIRVRIVDLDSTSLPSDQQSSGHLYLIRGTFEDIVRYAGSTVDWVIKIAHLLCDPLGSGRVFTHSTGTPESWWNINRNTRWEEVSRSGPLQPKIYEFMPTNPIRLSKICLRQTRSITTHGTESSSNTFRLQLKERDGDSCVVSHNRGPIIASHLIPRRLDTEGAKTVVERFVGVTEATDVHRYHPSIGISLFSGLDHFVDTFEAGFYHHGVNNTYILHNFSAEFPNLSYVGTNSTPGLDPLHGHSVTLQVHAGTHLLPSPGVFNWHYLQCVIKMFGTPEYNSVSNIWFYIFPFRTASDSSSGDDDFDTKPPYPSYRFERSLARQMESRWAKEREKEVLRWASGVPSTSGVSVQSSDDRTNNE